MHLSEGNIITKIASDEAARILVKVAITSIVFLKGVYPTGALERRRYMNLVVQRARHPELRDNSHSVISCLLPFIQMGLVERAAVIFFNSNNKIIERFLFKVVVNQSYGSNVGEAPNIWIVKLDLSSK
ncbi:hypothetical protein FEM48_Zijuj02G0023900 [Ziziphus jujuba var. spinosa]|uniref:HORMA domain-containing protein n=1 Tax=Ziziphus jujuba var. spinosa TaxID=714518 RepID=A0A978VT26_ZIZJJ|nr:hypothetical protein FEM48_Zijuj02G0023900 [Ziziphus jujuba var. spinosa]